MAQTEHHYYLVSDLRDLRVPAQVHEIKPGTEIPKDLRFTFSDSGLTPEKEVVLFELPSGRKIVSQGTEIPFPILDGTYRLQISNFRRIYIWTTNLSPKEWERVQPHHTFSPRS